VSYKFKSGETVTDGVRRIAREQLDIALELANTSDDLDLAVHDIRVAFKKLRGLLRLIRQELGADLFQTENTWYRDSNRRLSAVRDSAALTEALDKLQTRFAEQLADDAFAAPRYLLSQLPDQTVEKTAMLQELAQTIGVARRRIEEWPPVTNDFSALSRGLRKVYQQGRRKLVLALEEQTTEAFHEWRKEVKYHWYHIRLLQALWPEQLKQLAAELKTLSGYLSEHHDLAILSEKVLTLSNDAPDRTAAEALAALTRQRQKELEACALILGERVYAEEPGAFTRRFKEYWRAWLSSPTSEDSNQAES
jgi:CHAD domain-containing protein